MKITPIKRYPEPGFPTRAILNAHPELLRLVPKRWHNNPTVLTALTTVCILTLGYQSYSGTKDQSKSPSHIAPIFQHGDGRGALGCVAVNPPVFLSEDEARHVINEEAKKAGIVFQVDPKKSVAVRIPSTNRYDRNDNKEGQQRVANKLVQRSVVMDGYDRSKNLAYEYVSEKDFESWEKQSGPGSSVYSFDIIGATQALRQGLEKAKPRGTYALFYDPMQRLSVVNNSPDSWMIDWQEREKLTKEVAQEQLRVQVRDFIAWLKSQGVI